MSTSEELAERFMQSQEEFIEAVEDITDEQWKLRSSGEGWTIGAVVHHVALPDVVRRARASAAGAPLPAFRDMAEVDAYNARESQEFIECDRAETMELLRAEAASFADWMRGLSDEELSRSAQLVGNARLTTHQIIEGVLIPHIGGHLTSIQATLERMD